MKNNLFVTAVVAATFLLPLTASAKDARQRMREATTTGAYGDAGCGLGSIVFGNEPGYIQIVAATLNGTGGQTFAITTGTSNCPSPSGGHLASQFIKTNGETLKKDIARGQGETIDSLAMILKCSDSKMLGQTLRANFDSVMGEATTPEEKTNLIFDTIQATPELNKTCGQVG